MGGGLIEASFSPVFSTNVGISHQNYLNFSFNPFVALVKTFKFVPSVSPKLLISNQNHSSKKQFFWTNTYKLDVMINSLIEMLELPNLDHMTTSTI